jgi:hypothetical protein
MALHSGIVNVREFKVNKAGFTKRGGTFLRRTEIYRNLRGGVITVNVIWKLHTFREMAGMTFNLIPRALKLIFNDD